MSYSNFYSIRPKCIYLIAILFSGFAFTLNAQGIPEPGQAANTTEDTTGAWKSGAQFNFNFQNVSLSNWNGGGESTLAINSVVSLYANKSTKTHFWNSSLELGYGVNRQGGRDNPFIKSDDNIILLSSYGRKINPLWSIAAGLDFRSQFAPGYNYTDTDSGPEKGPKISNFMAPGYLLTTIGMTYTTFGRGNKEKTLNFTLSPLTSKSTFVLDDTLSEQGRYGVDSAQNYRIQAGANLKVAYKQEVMPNVMINSNLNLFADYETPQLIDVNFETIITFKVNDYITSSISTQLVYDDDIDIERDDGSVGPATQFKNVLNIGLSLSL